MSHWSLWLCVVLLIGSGAAADVPFVFDKNTLSIGSYTSVQLEQAQTRSPELAGVPYISTPAENAILEFPIVGGGNAPSGTIENKAGEYKKILNARVESDNSKVHEEALVLVAKYPGDYTIDQICSIFEYLKEGWHYVRDPRGTDYFNYANSTLSLCNSIGCAGIGDCDDFAVLMSALVESIGGTSRIILAQNDITGGHAYAEVYLGQLNDPSNQVNDIIKWLFQKYNTDKIFVHIETDTKEVWLNLDWGSDEKGNAHPGGPFYLGDTHHVIHIRDSVTKTPLKLPEGYKPKKPISQDTSALVNKAKALIDLGRNDEGLQASEKAIELDPDYAIAWNNKAAALNELHRYDEALQASEKAIELDPTYEKAWNNKAAALINLQRYDEALQTSEKAIKQNPYYAKTWLNKADSLFNLGRIDEALKASEKAIELDPTYEKAWNEKAVVLNNLGRYDEALQAAERAIELKPTYAKAWLNKGKALLNQGKYDQAVKAFDEAIRLDPNYDMAWNNKGWTLYKQGKYDEALQAYDKAVKINPKFAKAWNNIGTALSALHRDAEADAAFAKASGLGQS